MVDSQECSLIFPFYSKNSRVDLDLDRGATYISNIPSWMNERILADSTNIY